jgi:hypothetical protein
LRRASTAKLSLFLYARSLPFPSSAQLALRDTRDAALYAPHWGATFDRSPCKLGELFPLSLGWQLAGFWRGVAAEINRTCFLPAISQIDTLLVQNRQSDYRAFCISFLNISLADLQHLACGSARIRRLASPSPPG